MSAELRLYGNYASVHSSESITLYEVTTSGSTVQAGGSGFTSIFNDLGSGQIYGTTVSASDWVSISLNAAFLSLLNSLPTGSDILIGGRMTTVDGDNTTEETMFWGSGSSGGLNPADGQTQLVIDTTPVPEPSTLALLGGGG